MSGFARFHVGVVGVCHLLSFDDSYSQYRVCGDCHSWRALLSGGLFRDRYSFSMTR